MFKQITDIKNIEGAYLDLYGRFLDKSSIYRYSGIDNVSMEQTEPCLNEVLKKAQYELVTMAKPRPAKYVEIPKTNGKVREIYILPVVERIKQQAIYRVLEPMIEKRLSFLLYSFRSEKPTYYALKSAVNFYLKNHSGDFWVYKTDFKDYSNYIDHDVLMEKLGKLTKDVKALQLFRQVLHYPFNKKGKITYLKKGVLQGMPLNCLFVNFYMYEVDHEMSKKVDYYRRVGDDILMFHHDEKELLKVKSEFDKRTNEAKLEINEEKTILQPIKMPFDYLGLHFENCKISFPEEKLDKFIDGLKNKLKPGINRREKLIKNLQIKQNGQSLVLFNYLYVHNLVNDYDQIKHSSKKIQNAIYAYLGGGFSYKKLKYGRACLKKIKFNSFYKNYLQVKGK